MILDAESSGFAIDALLRVSGVVAGLMQSSLRETRGDSMGCPAIERHARHGDDSAPSYKLMQASTQRQLSGPQNAVNAPT